MKAIYVVEKGQYDNGPWSWLETRNNKGEFIEAPLYYCGNYKIFIADGEEVYLARCDRETRRGRILYSDNIPGLFVIGDGEKIEMYHQNGQGGACSDEYFSQAFDCPFKAVETFLAEEGEDGWNRWVSLQLNGKMIIERSTHVC